jgi:hypothetical protein
MIELWINQAVHLSPGQALLLLALSVTLIGLMVVSYRQEGD